MWGCTSSAKMSTNSLENENDKNERQEPDQMIDTIDYSMKHPLQNCWTLWYFENDRANTWEKNQKEIASFETVEDFWSLYNHIKLASELRQGCDYSLFKKGIRPMWEDDANKRGGRWLINLDKKQRGNDLDRFWLDVILCLIGEAFENSEDVCGAVVNIRGKGDKIGIWTADAMRAAAVIEIGRKLKDRLRISPKVTIGYQVHKDTIDKAGSVTKNSYTV
ncbi:eukaryotic translation initiation factor 4E-1A-like isoform X1 [Onthophagus taurus]|uniref:eukaryotic translation initiation factor 4E-1A-like isoform X1 n=1 Tax=Onthophagus taurus TaxID=166361 RepID=UPI000C20337E|nr:eukaryotic translation initiation factor 4E-1A-like isoform X1 [Onthophagus taurus]